MAEDVRRELSRRCVEIVTHTDDDPDDEHSTVTAMPTSTATSILMIKIDISMTRMTRLTTTKQVADTLAG